MTDPRVKKIRWKKESKRRKGWPASTGYLNDHVMVTLVFDPELKRWCRVCYFTFDSGSHKTEESAKKKAQALFEKFILGSICKER